MENEQAVTEDVSPVIEAETPTTQEVDAMETEDFEEHFNNVGNDDKTNETKTEDETKPEVDMESLYKEQLSNKDGKLDKPIVIKVNGEVYEVDSIDELRNMAERGSGVTAKFEAMAEDRRTASYLRDNNISKDDLNTLINNRGHQPIERDEVAEKVNYVAEEIQNSSYVESFTNDISRLPDSVKEDMRTNPEMLSAIAHDYNTGLAQKIMPQVHRMMSLNGLSFEEAYISAGKSLQTQNESVQKKKEFFKSEPKASTTKIDSSSPSTSDVDKMSVSDFDAYFDSL